MRSYLRELVMKRGWLESAAPFSPDERILLVADDSRLAQAKAAVPGLVPYLLHEFDLLAAFNGNRKALLNVHIVKKILGGRVIEVRPPEITSDDSRRKPNSLNSFMDLRAKGGKNV